MSSPIVTRRHRQSTVSTGEVVRPASSSSVAGVIPERIRWAIGTLAVEPGDRLLEIGGGPGVAASLVCERLDRGTLLLIDRSPTAIERTRRRNPEHVASGRLALETVDVASFDPGKARFDKVFAVNVNVFWTTPATEELARIRRALDHAGRLFLFYETPSAARSRHAVARVVDALRANGFAEPRLISHSATLVGCVAHPA
jgi:cyclopropane fatty-acyl-phospholipid synthase-like methyltransferase